MDLFPLYVFIGLISAVLAYSVVIIDDRKLRTVFLITLLGVIGVANHLQSIEHAERINATNAQIVALAHCQGEGTLCNWETK